VDALLSWIELFPSQPESSPHFLASYLLLCLGIFDFTSSFTIHTDI
jgi:hypothetical protein